MGFPTIILNLMVLLYEVIKKYRWVEIIDWEPDTHPGSYEDMKNSGTWINNTNSSTLKCYLTDVLLSVYVCVCVCVCERERERETERDSCSVVSDSLRPHGLEPTRFLCPRNSAGKNTGVGCHSLLQGIFPPWGSNPDRLHCRQILHHLSHRASPLD